ncbi:dimethyl sulfoxide reductase anchor subunit family protein [Glaesserella sp.]|uniref:dimethyl sulfoxide reductase anchor subunit family protein n=1 Tax=Glaesserella sp. TaxID=2094731 RepID=UPI00359F7636
MNGLHELPLILFTVFAQSAVGAFLLFTFVLCQAESSKSRQYVHKVMFVVLALLGIGFIASILHLGSPLRAFNSLNRIGESMLSNEIASGSLFFALAGLYWLFAILNKMPATLEKIWLVTTAVVGLVFMYMMANVYQIDTVPTWYTPLTSWAFYLTVVVGGTVLGYTLLQPNGYKEYCLKWVPYVYLVGVILIAVVIAYQGSSLALISSSVQQASALVPDYAPLMALRLSALGIVAVILFRSQKIVLLSIAVIFVIGAELIGRTLFYGLHMTAGMAVAG